MTSSNATPPDDRSGDGPGGPRRRIKEADPDRLDALFDVLGDARRRCIVRILRTAADDSIAVATLADRLREREPDDSGRLVSSLHHVHLPKLEAAGVVTYDADRSTVRYEEAPVAEEILDLL